MQNNERRKASEEVSLMDLVGFFRRNKLPIVIGCLAGLLFSTAYNLMAQEKYEARWQMRMAQFGNININSNSNSEEPAALIQRLRMPTSYPLFVLEACGVQDDGNYSDYLDGRLKAEVVRNVVNAVDMRIVARSADEARQCAEKVVEMIAAQQHSLIEERLAGRQEQLKQYQQALHEEQQQLDKIKTTGMGNLGYLAKLDNLSWLRTRIDALQEESLLSQRHPARLIAPVYVPSKPVSPKVGFVLLIGVVVGLLLGLVYALGREGLHKVG